MSVTTPSGRMRAFGYFLLAAVYFYIAQIVAVYAANGLASGDWFELTERTLLLVFLLVGYGAMGRAFQRQTHPIRDMGLTFRAGWQREFGLGAALGWSMLLASILPIVLLGGLAVSIWAVPRQFEVLAVDLLVLAIASLGEEIAFRGYPFQRLIEAVGPALATLMLSVLFGLIHMLNPGANRASLMVTILCGWLLSVGYLRTRALWVSWGWHFAWNASMALLFGLPLSGITRFSPVIQSNATGVEWITGGDYGPEASVVTALVLLAGIVVLFRVTRDYAYLYAQPVIRPAGIPVDLDAMSRTLAPHHTTPATPVTPQLVQIGSLPQPPEASESSPSGTSENPPEGAE